jgi:hypothetical protein
MDMSRIVIVTLQTYKSHENSNTVMIVLKSLPVPQTFVQAPTKQLPVSDSSVSLKTIQLLCRHYSCVQYHKLNVIFITSKL